MRPRAKPQRVAHPTRTHTRAGANGGRLLTGNPGNRGGGRPTSVFLAKMQTEFDKAKAIEVAAAIISGDVVEQLGVDRKGRPIYGTTRNADRLRAIEWMANYLEGRPVQRLEHTGREGQPIEVRGLGNLTTRELRELERLLRKAQVAPDEAVADG